jgi:hypothetical protein
LAANRYHRGLLDRADGVRGGRIPVGRLLDRYGPRTVITGGSLLAVPAVNAGIVSRRPSVDGALVWLSGQFIASVMSTEVEVLNCTAAIYDADTEEVTLQWHGTSDELADLLDRSVGQWGFWAASTRFRPVSTATHEPVNPASESSCSRRVGPPQVPRAWPPWAMEVGVHIEVEMA